MRHVGVTRTSTPSRLLLVLLPEAVATVVVIIRGGSRMPRPCRCLGARPGSKVGGKYTVPRGDRTLPTHRLPLITFLVPLPAGQAVIVVLVSTMVRPDEMDKDTTLLTILFSSAGLSREACAYVSALETRPHRDPFFISPSSGCGFEEMKSWCARRSTARGGETLSVSAPEY